MLRYNAPFLQRLFSNDLDFQRCHGVLQKLSKHLGDTFMLTGGIATAWHTKESKEFKQRAFNDIDIVVEGLDSLPVSLVEDFLCIHFHPAREAGRTLIQLVDESNRVRVDVFTPYSSTAHQRANRAQISDVDCAIIASTDLLARLAAVLLKINFGEQVDPKHHESFTSLLATVDPDQVEEIWQDYWKEAWPSSFNSAIAEINKTVASKQELLIADSHDRDINAPCIWCVEDMCFPLASREKIFEILGYV